MEKCKCMVSLNEFPESTYGEGTTRGNSFEDESSYENSTPLTYSIISVLALTGQ